MDHELKQRLIGAVVVTALCAIFIPMLFDDPVDNNAQLVSGLTIPAPVNPGAGMAAKLPSNADQVLNLPELEPEPLSAETDADTFKSNDVTEGASEEPAKQRYSERSLSTESEGYSQEDGGAIEVVEQPLGETRVKRVKSPTKQLSEEEFAEESSIEPSKNNAPKEQVRDTPLDAVDNESPKVKKLIETAKPTTATSKDAKSATIAKEAINKTKKELPMAEWDDGAKTDALKTIAKPSGTATVANKPITVAPKTTPKEPSLSEKEDVAKKSALKTPAKQTVTTTVANKPEAVVPKVTPKLVRWYIQVGSFSKKENAISVWDSLRTQGFPTSLDTIQTDKGISYRLRVGPELDEKKARAMKSRLDLQNIKAFLISE